MNEFDFSMQQLVEIICSGESGKVIGQAHFSNSEDSYFIRYKASDGRAIEQWWQRSALQAS